MTDLELPDVLRDDARAAWQRYTDLVIPFRPDLYRYCRRLTRDIFDAEDLVQDALVRGFATLGTTHTSIRNPRAYLLRIATNLWIDTVRRRTREGELLSEEAREPRPASEASPTAAVEVRDAGTTLLEHLSPQERAAVVLKDVFDMSLEEISRVLGTTVGAIKAALHRGRERLREADSTEPRAKASVALIDRFVERFNSRDFRGLLDLMLESGTVEYVGSLAEVGVEEFSRDGSWFHRAIHGHPEYPEKIQAFLREQKIRHERVALDGRDLVIAMVERRGEEALEAVMLLEEREGRIGRLRAYGLCPEVVRAVGEALDVPVRTGLYRAPTPAPGKYFGGNG